MRDVVADMIRERKSIGDRTQQEGYERMCSNYLERYFYLLVFNSYLAAQQSSDPSTFLTFTQWIKTKSEIATLLHHMHANPQQALKIVLPSEQPSPALLPDEEEGKAKEIDENTRRENEVKQVILDRTGDVLVTNTILKADHFPGCQRKGKILPISLSELT